MLGAGLSEQIVQETLTHRFQPILRNAGFDSVVRNPWSKFLEEDVICSFSQTTSHIFSKSVGNLSTSVVYLSNKLLRLQIYIV